MSFRKYKNSNEFENIIKTKFKNYKLITLNGLSNIALVEAIIKSYSDMSIILFCDNSKSQMDKFINNYCGPQHSKVLYAIFNLDNNITFYKYQNDNKYIEKRITENLIKKIKCNRCKIEQTLKNVKQFQTCLKCLQMQCLECGLKILSNENHNNCLCGERLAFDINEDGCDTLNNVVKKMMGNYYRG